MARSSAGGGSASPWERVPLIGSAFAVNRYVTLEQLRRAYDAQPFVPFVLHLADGRGIPVRGREFIVPAPSGRTIGVHQPEGRTNVIDLLLVTDLEFETKPLRPPAP